MYEEIKQQWRKHWKHNWTKLLLILFLSQDMSRKIVSWKIEEKRRPFQESKLCNYEDTGIT
jgi:hypothetical protein